MKKLYILLCITLLWFTHGSFAESTTEQKLETVFNRYVTSLWNNNPQKQLSRLTKLWDKIDLTLERNTLTESKRDLIKYLSELNNNALIESKIMNQKLVFDSYI